MKRTWRKTKTVLITSASAKVGRLERSDTMASLKTGVKSLEILSLFLTE